MRSALTSVEVEMLSADLEALMDVLDSAAEETPDVKVRDARRRLGIILIHYDLLTPRRERP